MAYTTTGTSPQEQQTALAVTSTSYTYTRRFKGVRTDIDALANSIVVGVNGVSSYNVTPAEGPTAELVIEYKADAYGNTGTNENPISTEWNLDTGSAQVPLTEHPDFLSAWNSVYLYNIPAILQFQEFWDGKITRNDFTASTNSAFNDYPFFWVVIKAKERGVSGFYRGEPTLQVVDRYQGSAPWGWDTADINTAYTDTQLKTALGARTVNSLPADVSAAIRSGEWLCDHISANISSDGTRVVTQNFRWAPAWDTDLYTHSTL